MKTYTETFEQRGRSYNNAMAEFPHARDQELAELLNRLSPLPGETILDAPAGGGYVADRLKTQGAEVVCVEPSSEFASPLEANHTTIISPIWDMHLQDQSVDKVASLAGLHHLSSVERRGFFNEAWRVLRPGGQIVVADVRTGSAAAAFLNGPVDRWTETGHRGVFFALGELRNHLVQAKFLNTFETEERVTWQCPDLPSLARFVHQLFGMVRLPTSDVMRLIVHHLEAYESPGGAYMPWSLTYASGTKPLDPSSA